MATLEITEGKGTGGRFEVVRPAILGRQKGVQVLVDDVGASREHAKVFQQDGDWYVIDLNSRNGTRVNGNPVSRWRLNHGDLISIGHTAIRFDAPEIAVKAPPASAPPRGGAAAGEPAGSRLAAAPEAPAKPRGPSAIEMERERLRTEATRRQGPRATADDGSGIVIKESVLQYGRIEDKGGLLREDVGQRGGLFKILLALVLAGVFAGIVWGIATAMKSEPVEEFEDAPADGGGG